MSLDKFGVPVNGTKGPILQPKYKYRFRVLLNSFGIEPDTKVLTQNVVSVTKPSVSHEIVTVHAYNSRAYFAGKHEWETMTLVVRDDITNATSRLISSQVQKQLDHLEQTGWRAGMDYKFQTVVEVMDGGSRDTGVLEIWKIDGCFLSGINWGDMDYSTSESQTISMTIRFDNAIVDTMTPFTAAGGLQDPGGTNLVGGTSRF